MAPPKDFKEPRRSNRRSAHSSTSASKSSGSPSPDEPIKDNTDNHSASSTSNNNNGGGSGRSSKRPKNEPATTAADESSGNPPPSHRRTTSVTSVSPALAGSSKRGKRRTKEPAPSEETSDEVNQAVDVAESAGAGGENAGGEDEEEESGETRCICGDSDAGGFMIQCEMCKTWQHGPCMDLKDESAIPDGAYYCEKCKPEDHVELLARVLKNSHRQGSEKAHNNASHASRTSRSHSPSHMLKPPKRRNTMNSRDAAYEESLKELLNSTAAEASGSVDDKEVRGSTVAPEDAAEDMADTAPSGRKKRKRTDDEQTTTKRKRSASSASDRIAGPSSAVDTRGESVGAAAMTDLASLLPPPAPTNKSRVRRGGGGGRNKSAAATAVDVSVNGDAEEAPAAPTTRKHPNQYTYRKSAAQSQPRRPPASSAAASSNNAQNQGPSGSQSNSAPHANEHGSRRNASTNAASSSHHHASTAGTGPSTRGSHHYQQHYNNTQMPMFSSWGLPDYLAHLQSVLPNDVPPPLTIRGASSFFREDVASGSHLPSASSSMQSLASDTAALADVPETNTDAVVAASNQVVMDQLKAGATGTLTERGVKAKWPAKRMSVADMNKRVRALVEWVGREQALELDRERRKNALEEAYKSHLAKLAESEVGLSTTHGEDGNDEHEIVVDDVSTKVDSDNRMAVDGPLTESPSREAPDSGLGISQSPSSSISPVEQKRVGASSSSIFAGFSNRRISPTTMMEELMSELISFQERFGPGAAKGQMRERGNRTVAVLA